MRTRKVVRLRYFSKQLLVDTSVVRMQTSWLLVWCSWLGCYAFPLWFLSLLLFRKRSVNCAFLPPLISFPSLSLYRLLEAHGFLFIFTVRTRYSLEKGEIQEDSGRSKEVCFVLFCFFGHFSDSSFILLLVHVRVLGVGLYLRIFSLCRASAQ